MIASVYSTSFLEYDEVPPTSRTAKTGMGVVNGQASSNRYSECSCIFEFRGLCFFAKAFLEPESYLAARNVSKKELSRTESLGMFNHFNDLYKLNSLSIENGQH